MNRHTPLARSALVSVGRFDHPAGEPHRDPAEEDTGTYSVAFVEAGAYEMTLGREHHRFSPGMVFLTRPGQVYRCRHPHEIPSDTCLVVTYADALADEVLGAARRRVVLNPTNRLAYSRLRLLSPDGTPGDALGLEVRAAEVLAAVAAAGLEAPSRPFRSSQIAWYTGRIDAARDLLERRYADEHSLASLARHVAMSPFHFARVFRGLTGTPPNRYLLRVRLARAAARLRDGMPVTDTCFDVGFSNLSHFTRLFHRAYGVPPSRYRQVN
jgi:AraC family transcriptional regulator